MSPADRAVLGVVPAPHTPVLADLIPGTVARDAVLVLGAAGAVGLLAQLAVHLPFTPVPVTGQTLGAVLAGSALGCTPFLAGDAVKMALASGLLPASWRLVDPAASRR